MRTYVTLGLRNRPSLPLVVLALFMMVLLLAGGASRGDVSGQALVRIAAWCAIGTMLLINPRGSRGAAKPIAGFLAAMAVLAVLQMIPLPPSLWQHLPGHQPFLAAGALTGQTQTWRPLSISPSATCNALWSLVVPVAVLMLWTRLRDDERLALPGLLIAIIAISALVGLFQVSGADFTNPFINETAWDIRGTLSNRNHFAVLLALGCLIVPVWALTDRKRRGWWGAAAIGLLMVFVLMILATGSRAGLLVGLLALGFAAAIAGQRFRNAPRWLLPVAITLLILLVAVALVAGRAISVDRALTIDPRLDMRTRSLPWVTAMVVRYFPWGSGLGSFDAAFRMIEPVDMLKPTYFNHAHNDLLEIALTSGLPGLLVLLAAVIWMGTAAARVWRASISSRGVILGRLGSAVLLLVLIASIFDYPGRSPLMMTVIVLAALWLSDGRKAAGPAALPGARFYL